jgi:hypothetical protein
VINGIPYVIMSLTGVLVPRYQGKLFLLFQPALFGVLVFMLWLVIEGAKPPALGVAASSSAAG